MRIDVLTLFPGMFTGPMSESMMWKAQDRNLLQLQLHDIRDHSKDKHRSVDDTPYGGGGGMVLRADVLVDAVESVVQDDVDVPVILMSPQGRLFTHDVAVELAQHQRLIIVCGHYEGVDERVRQLVITDEISIGDYVLTGGELGAMVVIDAVSRFIPGVLGAEGAQYRDSHANGLLEGPQYTRPAVFRGLGVPEVLTNGHHARIDQWRYEQSLLRTLKNRPDLLARIDLSDEDKKIVERLTDQT